MQARTWDDRTRKGRDMSDKDAIRKKDEAVVRREERDLIGLCREARRGGITRRQFIERALVLGLSATSVGALAGACGGGGAVDDAASIPPMDETKPAEVNFFNWTDYLNPAVKKDFEKETGIRVVETYYSSNEQARAKLAAGATGYDVVTPTDYMCHVMIKSGLLEPLDMKYLPNYQYAGKQWQNPPYDSREEFGELRYGMPYMYGTTGYSHRTDKIPGELTDWTPMFDPANKGKINMLENEEECINMALLSLGYSIMTTSQDELDQATEKLIEQKPLVAAYDSVNMKRAILQGQALVLNWDFNHLMAIDALSKQLGSVEKAMELVPYVRPTEGYYLWSDSLCCPVGNNSRYGAHLWIDYLMDPKVSGKNASWCMAFSCMIPASVEYTDEFALLLKPTDEELANAKLFSDVGDFQRNRSEAWRKVKAA